METEIKETLRTFGKKTKASMAEGNGEVKCHLKRGSSVIKIVYYTPDSDDERIEVINILDENNLSCNSTTEYEVDEDTSIEVDQSHETPSLIIERDSSRTKILGLTG